MCILRYELLQVMALVIVPTLVFAQDQGEILSSVDHEIARARRHEEFGRVWESRREAVKAKQTELTEQFRDSDSPEIPREARVVVLPLSTDDREVVLNNGKECLSASPVDWLGVSKALGLLATDIPTQESEDFVIMTFANPPPEDDTVYYGAIASAITILSLRGTGTAQQVLLDWATLPLQDATNRKFFPNSKKDAEFDSRLAIRTIAGFIDIGPVQDLVPMLDRVVSSYQASQESTSEIANLAETYREQAEKIANGEVDAKLDVE